jgi:hypothetical protein
MDLVSDWKELCKLYLPTSAVMASEELHELSSAVTALDNLGTLSITEQTK